MKVNVGSIDRIIRIVAAIVIAVLYFAQIISGTVGIILMILASVFVLTGTMRFCPLYLPFGITTAKKENK